MNREVYINGQQIDVNNDDNIGYFFTSPIFRDITEILSNKTTTYRLPITENNCKVIGLSNNPDVISDFPYKIHKFEEYREGLPFIKGECTLLQTTDSDIQLSVNWGNKTNMLKLSGLKLRDLDSVDVLQWDSLTQFLPISSNSQKGFIVTDFGRGIDSMMYIHPSVTIKYILDLIEDSTGVDIEYPERFESVFKNKWFPLLSKYANENVWSETYATFDATTRNVYGGTSMKLVATRDIQSFVDGGLIQTHNQSSNLFLPKGKYQLICSGHSLVDTNPNAPLIIKFSAGGFNYTKQFSFERNILTGKYVAYFSINVSFDIDKEGGQISENIGRIWAYLYNSNNTYIEPQTSLQGRINYYPEETKFNYPYPVTPNLPDMGVIDFIKMVMQLYGLYAWYDVKKDNNITLLSIKDIYDNKDKAYNWDSKLIENTTGRYSLTFGYGNYTQRNIFKYSNDNDVDIDADGILKLNSQTVPDEDNVLVELKLSPSINTGATQQTGQAPNDNIYAQINLYDEDGNMNDVTTRILTGGTYRTAESDLCAAYFDDTLKFEDQQGLLKQYYDEFQYILLRPVVADCTVKFDSMDLFLFKEIYPVFIDGVYYMPIDVIVDANGAVKANLIKMPPR